MHTIILVTGDVARLNGCNGNAGGHNGSRRKEAGIRAAAVRVLSQPSIRRCEEGNLRAGCLDSGTGSEPLHHSLFCQLEAAFHIATGELRNESFYSRYFWVP